ncbi:MAG: TonB-dependent receptor [Phenylobacterium sp.]|uniref:TonB-dependent receptor n=1 Tax=Phenylobacterium sp. TaxID=1871053 RepID=UPI001A4D6CF8|nr:TonB-dependent receptor [Phenylobacterium sp.]MBL8771551.1 TonB-dependent receptor [Phenylobacterium sp.]
MSRTSRSPYRLTFALAMALSGGVAAVPAVSRAQAADTRDALAIEEVVVTARKREENLQETPIAITAVGGEQLQARGAVDLTAIETLAPNVHFSANQPTSGLSGATAVFIRGIGQRDFTINIDPAVGVYFDGVYVGRSIGALMDLVEIERVEVLRGPQNTLFGRNTIGGAISVVTKSPAEQFGGSIRVSGGEDTYAEVAGSVNVPLSETVRASLSAFYRHQDGFVKALQYNDVKLGEDDVRGARAKLVFDFSPSVSLELAGDIARTSNTPGPVVPVVLNTLLPVGTVGTGPFNTFFNNSLTLSGDAACRTTAGHATNSRCFGSVWLPASRYASNAVFTDRNGRKVDPDNQLDTNGISATLTADTPLGQFKSISAYRDFDAVTFNDLDFTPYLLFANNHPEFSQHQYSQEFQLVGSTANGKVDYVLGLYYFEEKGLERIFNQIVTAFNATTNPGSLAQDIFRNIDNSSKAAYAQVTYHLTDALSITGGARYTEGRKTFRIKNILPSGATDGPYRGVKEVERLTPTITVGWKATPDSYLYATYSEGFRDGGFAARFLGVLPANLPSYDPEFVEAYEVGSKNVLFDGRLRLNAAVFHTKYKDLQVDATVPPALQISQQSTILNLAQARMQGVEVEFDGRLTEWLRVDGAVGYLDADIQSVLGGRVASGAFGVTTATDLPYTPKWTANLGVTATTRVAEMGKLAARFDLSYSDTQTSAIDGNYETKLRSRSHLNASLRYTPDGGRWEAGLYVRNLTNDHYFVQKTNIQALNSAFGALGRPRTIFASVTYRFGN